MCSNASITEILGINDKNLVILGNEKENIKGIEYTVLRGKLSYRPACCPKCGIVNENRVEYVTTDMYKPYIDLAKKVFPNANIVVDKFHIVQLLTRELNK